MIHTLNGKTPQLGENVFVAPTATIIGDVSIGNDCSIWFNTVLRGDVNAITVGDKVNIQDGVIVHCTYKKTKTHIGNNVSIGHRAIIHGCTIHDNVLVGMGAIIMDNCLIHSNSIIAAGAVVLENTIVEEGSVYAGIPAHRVKQISPDLLEQEIHRIANNYVFYADWYKDFK